MTNLPPPCLCRPFRCAALLLVLVPLVAACAASPERTRPEAGQPTSAANGTPVPPSLSTRALDMACPSPCIDGVTPGQTSANEAEALLKANPHVARVAKYLFVRGGYLTWSHSDGVDFRADFLKSSSPRAETIHVIMASYPQPSTLEQTILAHGTPSHVVAIAYPNREMMVGGVYSLWIVYLSLGYAREYLGLGVGPGLGGVDARLQFSTEDYFVPSQEGFAAAAGLEVELVKRALVPWQGYQSFTFYCTDDAPELSLCKE